MHSSYNSGRFYLPQLDGLRFFAFLGVFECHFFADWIDAFLRNPTNSLISKFGVKSISLGAAGVDVFFALSAYLITELLLRERRRLGAIDLKSFYFRRALRIWPLYYGSLCLAFVAWVIFPALAETRKYFPYFAIFAGNFTLCRWGPPILLGPLWSVSVEEQFYFLWPLAVSRLSRHRLIWVAAALWMLGVAFRVLMRRTAWYAISFNTLARLDPIAAGILVAIFLDGRTNLKMKPAVCGLMGASLFGVSYFASILPPASGLPALAESMVALGSAAFLVGAIASGPRALLASRPLIYLGRISYGLYVFHMGVIVAFGAIFGFPAGVARFSLMALELALTVIVAAASYRWFEKPFLGLKARFQRVASGNQENDDAAGGISLALMTRVSSRGAASASR